ncbi:MAG: alpha/beta hydrolase [Eubacteriaceae bacterium]|nr:alpha/beta hydrolase [Eubacteriaceae bacterium]
MMIIAGILSALAAAYLAVCYGVYRFAFYSPDKYQNDDYHIPEVLTRGPWKERIREMISAVAALEYEKVSITSRDGLRLNGRYFHSRDGAPLDICFHGYRGTPNRDFSGGAMVVLREGHNLLMVEERAQCSSQGHTMTFGVKERFDALDWVSYAVDRFGADVRIIMTGISMGASTVLMASGMDLPENVRGIVADCPFTQPMDIILSVASSMKIPQGFSRHFARAAARIFGGFDICGASALEAVKSTKVPILLIHGEADDFVPCDMSRRIYEANPSMTDLNTFPGATHGVSFLADEARYEELVRSFSSRVLGDGISPGP